MTECSRDHVHHHHKGKSSEDRLDKALILSTLAVPEGAVVLDAGCGNGYMSKAFAEQVGSAGKVYSLDPDGESIEQLQAETRNTVIEAFVGDITVSTPLDAGSVDLLYISNVIHGFNDEQMNGFAQEVSRLLKPDGRLAVLEIKKEETPFGPPMDIRIAPDELSGMLGLTPVETVEISSFYYLQILKK